MLVTDKDIVTQASTSALVTCTYNVRDARRVIRNEGIECSGMIDSSIIYSISATLYDTDGT